jgi:hypothetical protein
VIETHIDHLVYEWGREVFFGKILIEVAKISAHPNSTLFFVDRNWV